MSASTSCNQSASELLAQCVAGSAPDEKLIRNLSTSACTDALFRILVEGLADRFEPRLCDAYAEIFTRVIERNAPEFRAADLLARYGRIRDVRAYPRGPASEPERVVVLSRVTLGADIAVTSVILDAVKRRFPQAEIYLAGSTKAAELFRGDPRIQCLPVAYPRGGSVVDRIACWRELTRAFPLGRTLIVDPDSRLTQLGLLPTPDDDSYFFFESRAFGGERDATLGQLAAEWARATFGVQAAEPYLALPQSPLQVRRRCVTVSLGVGGNPAKRLSVEFEQQLIRWLSECFAQVIVDRGSGAEENVRAERAVAGTAAQLFEGSFAAFASVISQSNCYVGYDSAGQHAAAALGIPLITLFKGFVSSRMFQRWQPHGPGPKQVIKIDEASSESDVMAALAQSSFFRKA